MHSGDDILRRLTVQLTDAVEDPSREARLLLMHLTGRDPRLPSTEELTATAQAKLTGILERRLAGEPLQYILGEWEFMGIPFAVGQGVLCPRPDSECLVERAIDLLHDLPSPTVIDLCAGSGALAVSIKKFVPSARVLAVEKYPEAFDYLLKNVTGYEVEAIKADICDYHNKLEDESVSLIISNPPYIPLDEREGLAAELSYEPDTALFEPSYLYFYRLIAKHYTQKLKKGGAMILEIPTFKEQDVADILKDCEMVTCMVSDYNQTVRGVLGIKTNG